MCGRSCTTHCPQAVWQCAAGVQPPTAPKKCGGVLQEFHCLLPPGGVAVYRKSSAAHCPKAVRQCAVGVPLPHCPRAVWQCAVEVPLPTVRCPLPRGSVAVCSRSSTSHYPLPTAPRQCGRVLREYHSPLPQGSEDMQNPQIFKARSMAWAIASNTMQKRCYLHFSKIRPPLGPTGEDSTVSGRHGLAEKPYDNP